MTTTPQQRVEADLKAALKAGEKEKLSTLRLLLAEIKNEAIRRGSDVDEGAFAGLLRKAIKSRHEAAEQYVRGGREELSAKEQREASYLESYLPPQAGEDDIRQAIRELVEAEGLSGPQALGRVMKAMMARFAGTADGAVVNRLAREILAESE